MRDLISKILNTDPDKRYSIEDIRNHRWYNQLEIPQAPSLETPDASALNEVSRCPAPAPGCLKL